jgi:hypothetical protein
LGLDGYLVAEAGPVPDDDVESPLGSALIMH